MQDVSTDHTSPFLCRDAIKVLSSKSRITKNAINKIYEKYNDILELPLLDICKGDNVHNLSSIVRSCKQPVVIAIHLKGKRNRYKIVADFRFTSGEFDYSQKDTPWSKIKVNSIKDDVVYIFIEEISKALMKKRFTGKHKKPKFICSESFKADFFVEPEFTPPQTLNELKDRLGQMNLLKSTNVYYRVMSTPSLQFSWYIGYDKNGAAPLMLEAFTRHDLSIAYRVLKESKITTKMKNPFEEVEKARLEKPDPTTKNRKSSVQVGLTALNLAIFLGMCTQSEMIQIAKNFSKYVGTLWITFDEKKNPRHVLYRDCLSKRGWRLELKGCNALDDWSTIIERIAKSAENMKPKKEKVFSTLFSRFIPYLKDRKHRSKWMTCTEQLRQAINRHRVFVFTSDDTALHAIKVPLAGHFSEDSNGQCKKTEKRSVRMHTLPNNVIVALSCKGLLFTNLADVFDYKCQEFDPYNDDQLLWELASEWLQPKNENDTLMPLGPSPMITRHQNISRRKQRKGR